MSIIATPTPGKSLISAADHMLVMIDFQSQSTGQPSPLPIPRRSFAT